jgi:hypothetical protein
LKFRVDKLSVIFQSRRGNPLCAEDLKEIARNPAVLTELAVREVYQRAYRQCAIIDSRTFPSAQLPSYSDDRYPKIEG